MVGPTTPPTNEFEVEEIVVAGGVGTVAATKDATAGVVALGPSCCCCCCCRWVEELLPIIMGGLWLFVGGNNIDDWLCCCCGSDNDCV